MGMTLTEKILSAHLVEGEMIKGTEIGIRIDQTLTQDATGTMAYLEFEAMGVPRVKTERSVAYCLVIAFSGTVSIFTKSSFVRLCNSTIMGNLP